MKSFKCLRRIECVRRMKILWKIFLYWYRVSLSTVFSYWYEASLSTVFLYWYKVSLLTVFLYWYRVSLSTVFLWSQSFNDASAVTVFSVTVTVFSVIITVFSVTITVISVAVQSVTSRSTPCLISQTATPFNEVYLSCISFDWVVNIDMMSMLKCRHGQHLIHISMRRTYYVYID